MRLEEHKNLIDKAPLQNLDDVKNYKFLLRALNADLLDKMKEEGLRDQYSHARYVDWSNYLVDHGKLVVEAEIKLKK